MGNAYIVSACRTAIGSFGGSLKDIKASKLGEAVITEAIKRAGIKAGDIDEVILGNVLQAGLGQNPARQAAMGAGIPCEVPAMTINRVCGSGLRAVALAAQLTANGEADCIAAGGMESMSQAPYLMKGLRWGAKMGSTEAEDHMVRDGLWDAFNDYHMGITAENIAAKYSITREEQDEYAFISQQKASGAKNSGKFKDEIVPVLVTNSKREQAEFADDEYIKEDASFEKLLKLKPAFKKDGSVTAGNASGINDGAAAFIIASEGFIRQRGIQPVARIISSAARGVDPSIMGMGPVPAVRAALQKANLSIEDIDLIEANEAFAVQAIAVARELGLDAAKVNVNGGAIALGHPIGASGARILVTLLYEMKRRSLKHGLAALCVGGGMGEALVVEALQ